MENVLFLDTECYRNFFGVAFKRLADGKRIWFEFSRRADFDRDRVRRIMRQYLTVGFNSRSYDLPMIYAALAGAENDELKRISDRIIKTGIRPWEIEDRLGIYVPAALDHVDLIEPNPAVMQGLKVLNGRLHGRRLQDLPYDPDIDLSEQQMEDVKDYCLVSDLDGTENLFNALREPLDLRVALSKQYEMDLRSKSDAQVGEAIIKHEVARLTGRRIPRPRSEEVFCSSFRYHVPDFISFETPMLQEVLRTVRETDFYIDHHGKVEFPKEFEKFKIEIGGTTYKMGIGGLHSTEANRALRSTDTHVLIDADVASQYPSIIMKLGLYPEALGADFLTVYGSVKADRIKAKAAGDKVKDKAGKIALNGCYGKLGSPFSVLFAPHLMIAVTLTGQLTLLMLIEKAHAAGIPIVSANTDGVVFFCPRDKFDGFVQKDGRDTARLKPSRLADITDWWERVTSFDLEFAEYRAIYNQSVNSYFAVKSSGKVKRKGPLANPWSSNKDEFDLRGQMMKNPQMFVCSDAALAYITHGTPLEETIRGCRDVRAFVTVINAAGGATWRDGYLGKVVRYYWSTDGDPIIKVKPHVTTGNRPKVPKTEGCRPMMMLADELPPDVDFGRYVAEARKILEELGAVVPARETVWATLVRDVLKFN